jgi:hypothetical protein
MTDELEALRAENAKLRKLLVIERGGSPLNDASWELHNGITNYGPLTGHQFNNLKPVLREAIKVHLDLRAKELGLDLKVEFV